MQIEIYGKKLFVDFQHDSEGKFGMLYDRTGAMAAGTVCRIFEDALDTREDDLYGDAIVHPNDRFSKRMGRKIAFGNAISVMSRYERRLWWEAYFQVMPGDRN